jgi:arginine exporter protein ArgO
MATAFIPGFLLGSSLIVAIGAQNAFVLRQGLRREHVFAVCAVCAISDAILIAAGVAGFGALVKAVPLLAPVMRYGGAAFLFGYALRSLWSAWRPHAGLDPARDEPRSLSVTLMMCLAFTWLNPHVYLDTVVLLGLGLHPLWRSPRYLCAGRHHVILPVLLFLGLWRAIAHTPVRQPQSLAHSGCRHRHHHGGSGRKAGV